MRNLAQPTFLNEEFHWIFFDAEFKNGGSAEAATGTWQIIGKT